MEKSNIQLDAIKLVGLTARTSNAAEMNPETAKIGATMQKFFTSKVRDAILYRKNPSKIFSVYTNYDSDFTGDYTYFLGEEVTQFSDINYMDTELETLIIPQQLYSKFTSRPGAMPQLVINMWQNIWSMSAADLGGNRNYIADFEIYDKRSTDPQNAIVDVYIGINLDSTNIA